MANGHGGKRPGAGRKPGSVTKKTREIAEKATKEGLTPLEVMLHAMREAHAAGKLDEAHAYAKDAAPYMHARLAAVEHSGDLAAIQFNRIERVIISPRERIADRIEPLAKRTERAPAVIEDKTDAAPAPLAIIAPEEEREPEIVDHVDGPRIHLGGW
ncbi:hypothetical protein HUN39_17710 [Methylocystis sp. FS]|uniref:hypothetical protein n=1 Tax=Methylocystis silviterrae TaxID=2743612 RepID=UPI0015813FAB|nr:hypothetical protein [Methylocystis silviterrae]NUJ81825.1 hypothetical protein [Methylocystis silviterrae]